MKAVADELWHENDPDLTILEEPSVWGVQELGNDAVVIRLVVKTDPSEQWAVGRVLRARIKKAFDEASVEIPFPQRTVWIRNNDADDNADPRPTGSAGGRERTVREDDEGATAELGGGDSGHDIGGGGDD